MNKKDELIKIISKMLKNCNEFNVVGFEENIHEAEELLGREVSRKDEESMETELASNVKGTILKALDGEATLDKISIVEQIVTQAGSEYRTFKSGFMNEGINFFIDYLGIEDTIKTKEPKEPEELDDDGEER